MDEIKVGDRVRVSFSLKGKVIRFVQRRWGNVAVVNTGGYPREIPVANLTKLPRA